MKIIFKKIILTFVIINMIVLNINNKTVFATTSSAKDDFQQFLKLEQMMKDRLLNGDTSLYSNEYYSVGLFVPIWSDAIPSPYFNSSTMYISTSYKEDGLATVSSVFTSLSNNELREYFTKCDARIKEIEGFISDNMSDETKALIIHDYIAGISEYDSINYKNNTIPRNHFLCNSIIMEGTGVCQAYAEAYWYLMNYFGVECKLVTGETYAGSHAWNIVKINGSYYHVDCTWDDMISPNYINTGWVCHDNFLVSDVKIKKLGHNNWKLFGYRDTTVPKCTNTKYDDYEDNRKWSNPYLPTKSSGGTAYQVDFYKNGDVSPSGIVIDSNQVSLPIGNQYQLYAAVVPTYANVRTTVSFTSSNTKVATVSSSGLLKAIAEGTTTITAKTSNGKTVTCNVTVTIPEMEIKLNNTSLTLNKGGSSILTSTIKPSNATNKTVTWTSSNTNVATVDQNGKVTAINGGTATITATTSNGKTATCIVTVKSPIVSINLDKTNLSLNKNSTTTLKTTINPSNTTDSKSLIWISSNSKVATVNNQGKITAKANGTATITVKTVNGKTATCKVTVKTPVSKLTYSKVTNKTYTGKQIKPSITVKDGKKTLKNGTDYTVSYDKNKSTGKATITIKGEGKYVGRKTIAFYIIPKKVTISSVKPGKKQLTVKYKKVTGASGYQIAYSTSKSKGYKYITVNAKTASKIIKKLKSKKNYYVKVRAYKTVNKKKYYGAYSAIKSVKVR